MNVGFLLLAHDLADSQISRATTLKPVRGPQGPLLRFVFRKQNALVVAACERLPVRALYLSLVDSSVVSAVANCWWGSTHTHEIEYDRTDAHRGAAVRVRRHDDNGILELNVTLFPYHGLRLPAFVVDEFMKELERAMSSDAAEIRFKPFRDPRTSFL